MPLRKCFIEFRCSKTIFLGGQATNVHMHKISTPFQPIQLPYNTSFTKQAKSEGKRSGVERGVTKLVAIALHS